MLIQKHKRKTETMLESNLERKLKVSWWERFKFMWRMSGIRAKSQLRKLFGIETALGETWTTSNINLPNF